jgi:hypothetical protein
VPVDAFAVIQDGAVELHPRVSFQAFRLFPNADSELASDAPPLQKPPQG